MSEDHGPQTDPRRTFAATLPVRVAPRFVPLDLLAVVCDMLEDSGVTAVIDPELSVLEDEVVEGNRFFGRPQAAPKVALVINGVTIQVVGRDKPPFSPTDVGRLQYGDWTSGKDKIARARGYVVLTELEGGASTDLDFNYDRATAVTVVAAAIDRLIGAIGIVWHTSQRALPAEKLTPMFKDLLEGNAPVDLWIARLPLSDGTSGVATRGFYALLGAEIAVLSKRLSIDEAAQAASELATEILRGGEAPAHGERLHYERGVRFQVEHRAVGVDGGVPVVVLVDVSDARKAKPAAGNGPAAVLRPASVTSADVGVADTTLDGAGEGALAEGGESGTKTTGKFVASSGV